MNFKVFRIFLSLSMFLGATLSFGQSVNIGDITYLLNESNGTAILENGGNYTEAELSVPTKIQHEKKDYIVEGIGEKAFYKNNAIKSVTIPSSVTAIGDYAFGYCDSINRVKFGENCDFGSYAFCNCIQLKKVSITNPTDIGDHCFSNCSALETISINQTEPNVTGRIGDSCFSNCAKFNTLYYVITNEATEIYGLGENAFDGTSLKAICVNNDGLKEYKNLAEWAGLAQYLVVMDLKSIIIATNDSEEEEVQEEVQEETQEEVIPSGDILKGKRIIVFGDSKAEGVGNKVGKEYRSWAYYLQEEYGCIVTNAAVGGTHLTPVSLKPANNINGLGVYSLVKAWDTGDYSLVESAMEWAHNSKYADRWDHVEQIIKNTSATDYDIVCIEAGTNDWNNKLRVIGSWEDTKPIYNYTVALRDIIQTLYKLNPKLYILVIPPIVRQMVPGDKSTYSDYYLNPASELYLYDVSKAEMEIAKRCGADAIDAYYGMGFTYENWYPENTGDGTHPNEHGYRIMANKIGDYLLKNYANPSSGEAEHSETTVIYDNAQDVSSTFPAMIFDLNGRSMPCDINDLHNGFYIINGQKYYIKSNLK